MRCAQTNAATAPITRKAGPSHTTCSNIAAMPARWRGGDDGLDMKRRQVGLPAAIRVRSSGRRTSRCHSRAANSISNRQHERERQRIGNHRQRQGDKGHEEAEHHAQRHFAAAAPGGLRHRIGDVRVAHAHATESSAPKRRSRAAKLVNASSSAARPKSGHSVSVKNSSA